MNRFLLVSSIGVLCTIGAIATSQAQVTCENAQFDPALLEKYPNLPQACSDIIQKEGQDFAVVRARLERVNPSGSVVVRIQQPDGSFAGRTTLRTPPDLRVQVDGRPTRLRELATGQVLTAYVKVTEPVMALAPAEESTPLMVSRMDEEEPEEQMAAALPSTASPLPWLGLMGAVSLLLGGLLSVIRYRRR
jgi:LPXTG-motif cell wall-anchored protein